MLRDETESGGSKKRGEVGRAALLDSPTHTTLLTGATSVEVPPPYGAQRYQDALWKGGNKALPPQWHQFEMLNGEIAYYEQSNPYMISLNRPLPGVRLDGPGHLVPGCEWYISPLGRSYFINHDTRTSSWNKPIPERPAGSLMPECVIEGHSMCIWSLACVDTGSCNIISASNDGSIRQWKRDGEAVGELLGTDEGVISLAVSPDETMVVSGSASGRLRLWNIKEGSVVSDPWEGHSVVARCLDWSPNALEIASGSNDGTIRRWNPASGHQIAPPVETGHNWVLAIKYSPQGDKFASGGADDMINLWSKDGELLVKIEGHSWVNSLCWSKDGTHIFSASEDCTTRKWSIEGEERAVIRGHTKAVTSLCLSPDGCHLVTASRDCSVRIWDLETNQLVGEPLLHDDELLALAIPSDGQYVASAGLDKKVYLWSLEAALKWDGDKLRLKGLTTSAKAIHEVPRLSKQQTKSRGTARYGDDFWGNDGTKRTPGSPNTITGPSPPHRRGGFDFLRFTRQPANPPQPRRWNTSLFPVRILRHRVDVAPCRLDDRYIVAPPTEAEVAAAMQHASMCGNAVESPTSQGEAVTVAQGSQVYTQGQPSQTTSGQNPSSSVEEEEPSCVIGCCGFYVHFGRRRST